MGLGLGLGLGLANPSPNLVLRVLAQRSLEDGRDPAVAHGGRAVAPDARGILVSDGARVARERAALEHEARIRVALTGARPRGAAGVGVAALSARFRRRRRRRRRRLRLSLSLGGGTALLELGRALHRHSGLLAHAHVGLSQRNADAKYRHADREWPQATLPMVVPAVALALAPSLAHCSRSQHCQESADLQGRKMANGAIEH